MADQTTIPAISTHEWDTHEVISAEKLNNIENNIKKMRPVTYKLAPYNDSYTTTISSEDLYDPDDEGLPVNGYGWSPNFPYFIPGYVNCIIMTINNKTYYLHQNICSMFGACYNMTEGFFKNAPICYMPRIDYGYVYFLKDYFTYNDLLNASVTITPVIYYDSNINTIIQDQMMQIPTDAAFCVEYEATSPELTDGNLYASVNPADYMYFLNQNTNGYYYCPTLLVNKDDSIEYYYYQGNDRTFPIFAPIAADEAFISWDYSNNQLYYDSMPPANIGF